MSSQPLSPRFIDDDGVLFPAGARVWHEAGEYDVRGFQVLRRIQEEHYWYRVRHRFVLAALRRVLRVAAVRAADASAVDIGGGCGGWMKYLSQHGPAFRELAIVDSSIDALRIARSIVPPAVQCYHASLHHLPWTERWDVAFALDVVEHLDDDADALRKIAAAVRPGGLIVVTAPALPWLWSVKDEIARHRRRYALAALADAGQRAGLRVLDSRYFMSLLVPALWVLRQRRRPASESDAERRQLARRIHAVPPAAFNTLAAWALTLDAFVAARCLVPCGTSALVIFHRV